LEFTFGEMDLKIVGVESEKEERDLVKSFPSTADE